MSVRDVPIIPPPDLRNIVDKTASFVARNGPEFESRIQQNEQNNPKFNFLKHGDPYNSYYQFKVREFRDGGGSTTIQQQSSVTTNGETNKSTTTVTSTQSAPNQVQSKLIKSFAEKIRIHDPPPEYEFMIEPPSVLAQDLDIIKLTAQFVAIHGRSFLTNLMNREQRNYQFDFLRPQHGLFSYFTQLIEQYSKIINQAGEILNELHKEQDHDYVRQKIRYRCEWTKMKESEKQKEQEEVEKERLEYAQIDWHDFVVVETVDYQYNEQGMFPPPTTPEQVGSRTLMQQRLEEEQAKQRVAISEVVNETDLESELASAEADQASDDDTEKADKDAMPPPSSTNPLATNMNSLSNVVIRKDYDPKQAKKKGQQSSSKTHGWVISPITNERIPAEKLAEHMRYGLLDPRWIEQCERALQEKMQQEEVFAPGVAIESSLKQMAERRTDIFGVGIDETEIGKKIGEEKNRDKTKEKVSWDGFATSSEATARAARANITIEDQIQQIHKTKGLVEEDNHKDKIGPTMIPPTSSQSSNSNHMISSNASIQMPPSNQMIVNKPQLNKMPQQHHQQQQRYVAAAAMQHPGHPLNLGPMQGHPAAVQHLPPHYQTPGAQYAPPPMPHLFPPHLHPSAMPYLQAPPPPNQAQLNPYLQPPAPPSIDLSSNNDSMISEPASKRQRTEDSLIPEEEFLASHSGSLSLRISVPNLADKPELNMNGQIFSITLNLTDMVSVIKSKINEEINLAPGKQKLQYDGIFIKDSNSLAFYNMTEGSIIQLALKERGGKKK